MDVLEAVAAVLGDPEMIGAEQREGLDAVTVRQAGWLCLASRLCIGR